MGNVRIKVSDISGSRVHEVEAPDDVPVNRILAVLVQRMNLPLNSPDGQLMSYKLHHRRTGSQLLDNQTFAQANVTQGDELRLQPEITAGAFLESASADISESGTGLPHSRTLPRIRACHSIREVLECGSPMPLFRHPHDSNLGSLFC